MADTAKNMTDLTNAINTELHSHLLTDAIEKMKANMTDAERQDMEDKALGFSMSVAKAIMQCMVSTGGAYPALFCNTPGLTELIDVSQIGISTTTFIGGD